MSKRVIALLMTLSLLCMGVSTDVYAEENDDVVILFENDVHCNVDGYAKISALKTDIAQETDYVGVVSVGDYIQGSSLGAISKGEYIVNLINLVGYDALALGNHEFDYKITRLFELVDIMDTKPICCNFKNVDDKSSVFDSYRIVSYGNVDIAYIGVTTPDTITSSSPAQFKDEDGDYIYTFSGNNLYNTVQKTINAAKKEGADYIIGLTHLGTEDVYEEWSAQELIKNTTGFDVVLDGHSHSVVEEMKIKDKNGNKVTVASTGSKFENIGKLTISQDGKIKTELIATESYEKTDENINKYIEQINEEYAELGNKKIGVSKVDLITDDKAGNRLIRNAETNLGDFCADAFRIVTGADIGFMNGGGIRAAMSKGDVTFNDILSVFPFNNQVCVIEATGQDIVDMLELGVVNYPEEDGTFQHVSGITFNIDDSIESTVELDDNLVFIGVEGARRINNVKVLNKDTGEYEPIDLEKTYSLASHSYLLLDQGGGASMFAGAKVLQNDGMLDVEMLEIYITEHLGGVIGKEYATSQNRITIGATEMETDEETEEETNEETTEQTVAIPETSDDTSVQIMYMIAIATMIATVYVISNKRKQSN
ncbi:MAG: 5'-nucleotidase C-terminal domain-containing protein [Lachnospiraceae bacterium]|nr:5'-nucleotidase C-terminal domain-containing protein [Lachnospiraceae bacterium]